MGLLRTIPFAPNYTITRSGEVRHESNRHKPVPHSVHQGKYGMKHLAVVLDGERHYVWKILSAVWYENRLILNQAGLLLRWAPDETFVLPSISASRSSTPVTDPEEIQYIWYLYQQKKIPCWQMAEKSALLSHGIEDYKAIIKDILIASVR